MSRNAPKVIVAVRQAASAQDALALGIALAESQRAALLLVHVFVSPYGDGAGHYETALREEAMTELRLLREAVPPARDVSVRVVGAMSVAHGLHATARSTGARVIVAGRSVRSRARRVVHGDVLHDILRDAPCPVAVAAAGAPRMPGGAAALRVIAVGHDGTADAECALHAATELSHAIGAALHVLRVLDQPFVYADPPDVDAQGRRSFLRPVRAEARTQLDAACAAVPGDIPTTSALVEAGAAQGLCDAVGEADLLVLGGHHRHLAERVLRGGVGETLVARAPCAVLVVPRGAASGRARAAPGSSAAGP